MPINVDFVAFHIPSWSTRQKQQQRRRQRLRLRRQRRQRRLRRIRRQRQVKIQLQIQEQVQTTNYKLQTTNCKLQPTNFNNNCNYKLQTTTTTTTSPPWLTLLTCGRGLSSQPCHDLFRVTWLVELELSQSPVQSDTGPHFLLQGRGRTSRRPNHRLPWCRQPSSLWGPCKGQTVKVLVLCGPGCSPLPGSRDGLGTVLELLGRRGSGI